MTLYFLINLLAISHQPMQYFRFKYLPLSSFSSTVCPLDTLPFGTLRPASSDQSTTDKAGAKEHQLLGENPGCVKQFKILQTYFFIQSSYGHLHLREPIERHETGFEERLLKRKGQLYPTSWAGFGAERIAEWLRSWPGLQVPGVTHYTSTSATSTTHRLPGRPEQLFVMPSIRENHLQ